MYNANISFFCGRIQKYTWISVNTYPLCDGIQLNTWLSVINTYSLCGGLQLNKWLSVINTHPLCGGLQLNTWLSVNTYSLCDGIQLNTWPRVINTYPLCDGIQLNTWLSVINTYPLLWQSTTVHEAYIVNIHSLCGRIHNLVSTHIPFCGRVQLYTRLPLSTYIPFVAEYTT